MQNGLQFVAGMEAHGRQNANELRCSNGVAWAGGQKTCANAITDGNKKKMQNHTYKSVESVDMTKPHGPKIPHKNPSSPDGTSRSAPPAAAAAPWAAKKVEPYAEPEDSSDSFDSDGFSDIESDDEADALYNPGRAGKRIPQPLTQRDLDYVHSKLKFDSRQKRIFYEFLKKHKCLAEQYPKRDTRANERSSERMSEPASVGEKRKAT